LADRLGVGAEAARLPSTLLTAAFRRWTALDIAAAVRLFNQDEAARHFGFDPRGPRWIGEVP
jgi:hypothetical protein